MANEKTKALVFGALNLDYVYQMKNFVQAKQTVSSLGREIFCGGKGLNQALAMKRSGVDVKLAGAVGEGDSELLLEELKKAQISDDLIMRKTCPSGHAIIQTIANGENCILLYGGANQAICKEDVDQALKQFGKGDMILLQNEIAQMDYIMHVAQEKEMILVFNPSPMDEKLFSYPLAYVDYFVVNEEEGRMLCEGKGVGLASHDGAALLGGLIQVFPQKRIILTLGAKGSYYSDGTVIHIQPAYEVEAVDTTAAGDTFTGYLFGSLFKGETVQRAMDLAARASAIACGRKGAGPSIPTWDEVQKWNGQAK